ncbi:MAG: hypothetical protein CMC41_05795 [Flavobacteriaceae bacterium]|nr:hypothetical protein [Flavobacteriaceae bacterium]|tara:strand:+ start:3404 stop:3679 length:276 start_codon:yes stop_codon:yes gene_type:complete
MIEWFKKYLGWMGFLTWMIATLIFLVYKFILEIELDSSILFVGFLFMAGAQTIQDILNKKYFVKYSDKVKNGVIIFIITSTIVISYVSTFI